MSTYGIRLPKLLQKGCVLQRGEKTRVWGWCDPGQEVQIQLQGKSGSALADAQGRFEAYLENLLPGGPFTLKLQAGTEMLEVTPVYVGDVFVCAGQSNMELPMNREQEQYPEEFAKGECPGIFLTRRSQPYYRVCGGSGDCAGKACGAGRRCGNGGQLSGDRKVIMEKFHIYIS